MTPSTRLTVIVAASSVAASAAAAALGWALVRWARKWKSISPEEAERLRRLRVNRGGRIVSAQVVDLIEDAETLRRVVVYRYEVAGVTYEAAQDVFAFSGAGFSGEGLTGLSSSVKYDPKKPMNSIIACEGWSGLTPGKVH